MVAQLAAVIRLRTPMLADRLQRSVFAAALQDVRPVSIGLAGARPGRAMRAKLARIMALAPDAALSMDGRAGAGRYLAVLAEGDVIYPEGWRLLVAELEASGAAVALGGMLDAEVDRSRPAPFTRAKRPSAAHVFVADRTRIGMDAPVLERELLKRELLDGRSLDRLCAGHEVSRALAGMALGEREA